MIAWDAHHYKSQACHKKATELRRSGKYKAVKLGNYIREDGQTYCKIYVERA